MLLLLAILASSWGLVHALTQDLPTVLSAQPSLTKFTAFINDYPDLLTAAQAGVLAPNDAAFTHFFATPSTSSNYSSPDQLEALLSYHILTGVHSYYAISSTPQFIPTLLTNTTYTNVTNGQVVEALTNGTIATFDSAVNRVSKVLGPYYDIVFLGGFVHIIDSVLVPPLSYLETITEVPLTYLIADLGFALNDQFVETLENGTDRPDTTIFAPNSPQNAEAANSISPSEQELLSLLQYSTVIGQVLYSPSLTDGSTFVTEAGVNITITVLNGSTYVNDAKIIGNDLLTANGVVHVIDNYLNASNPGARPHLNTTASTSSSRKSSEGLSTGAEAGIGVGAALGALALIGGLFLVFRKRSRTNRLPTVVDGAGFLTEKDGNSMKAYEVPSRTYDTQELEGRVWRQELDGQEMDHPNGVGIEEHRL